MKQFVAVVSHNAGGVTKYQDFDTQAEADAHVARYGGKVVEGLDNDLSYWNVSGDAPIKDTVTQASDEAARAAEEVQNNRRAAYQEEADPLFFEEQRGEVSAGTHAAKVEEIKARFPK